MSMDHDAVLPAQVWLPLLRETLVNKGHFRWPLQGSSMLPTLPASCEIEIVPLLTDVRPGELIVFANGDALVAHRLVRCSGGHWITQGDGRLGPDSPMDPALALGRVSQAYNGGKRCWPGRFSRMAASFWVARFYLLGPARLAWHALRRLLPLGRRK